VYDLLSNKSARNQGSEVWALMREAASVVGLKTRSRYCCEQQYVVGGAACTGNVSAATNVNATEDGKANSATEVRTSTPDW